MSCVDSVKVYAAYECFTNAFVLGCGDPKQLEVCGGIRTGSLGWVFKRCCSEAGVTEPLGRYDMGQLSKFLPHRVASTCRVEMCASLGLQREVSPLSGTSV